MVDYNEIREVLRAGVWDALGRFFVDLENGDPRPDEQAGIDTFISYKFISPFGNEVAHEVIDDEKIIYRSQFQMTLSLTVYSKDKAESKNTALALRNWFRFQGYEYLKDKNLIVVEIQPMTDRTTFLDTDYDNRVGFDVVLRHVYTDERATEVIESAEINENIIGG